jgi:hypothetical protein
MNNVLQKCFFDSTYEDECVCGWTQDMIKEVPPEYINKKTGQVKFYQLNNYTKPEPKTVYGCNRNKQVRTTSPPKHTMAGKFIVYHKDNRVEAKDELEHKWSETMKKYLNNARVQKQGPILTCLGQRKKLNFNNAGVQKKQQQERMCACASVRVSVLYERQRYRYTLKSLYLSIEMKK